jgi:hypothetical protein
MRLNVVHDHSIAPTCAGFLRSDDYGSPFLSLFLVTEQSTTGICSNVMHRNDLPRTAPLRLRSELYLDGIFHFPDSVEYSVLRCGVVCLG